MSWPLVRLGDVCSITMGQAPKGSSYNENGKGLALIAGAGDFGTTTPAPKKFTTEPSKVSNPGDIILCIRATIGDTNWSDKQFCLGRGVAGLRVGDKLDNDYLWFFIKAHKDQLSSKGTGSTFKQVSRAIISDWEIPLPPLDEQKRIAAILDKADAIRQKRKQAIDLADEFLRSVFLDMFGDPVTNPKGFEKVCLSDICKIKGGKRIPKGEKLVKENTGFPYIKAGNIKNGKVNTNKLEYVPHHVREKISRYTVSAGDVCLTVVGANIGDVGIVPKELDNASLTENANKLLINNSQIVTNFYLASALQMDFIQNQIKSKTMAVGVPKLALFRIEQLELLLPPVELQKKYELIVERVGEYSNKMTLGNEFCGSNFSSLRQKAFSGQL